MPQPLETQEQNPNPNPEIPTTIQDSGTNNLEELIKTSLAESERARRESENRARLLEDEIAAMRKQQQAPVAQEAPVTNEQFWQNPVQNLKELISAQVAPLHQFVNQTAEDQRYETLKREYRVKFPAFTQIEQIVDRYMSGREISHASIQSAIREAVGEIALTNPQALAPQNNQQVQNQNQQQNQIQNQNQSNNQNQNQLPAHLRPSTNVANTQLENKAPKRRALTENERRIIRETPGMTEDRYWELLESDIRVDSFREKKK